MRREKGKEEQHMTTIAASASGVGRRMMLVGAAGLLMGGVGRARAELRA
jgi:hypothetical protein